MRIKKKTGIMMIAASTAAVVGVAAVSFAAWTGNTYEELTANAQTGTIYTFGFNEENASITLAGTKDTKNSTSLVPYNQPEATVKTGNYILSGKLPEYTVFGEDYSIAVTSAQSTADYKLYVKVSANITESVPTNITTDTTGWKAVEDTATLTKGETVTAYGAIWYTANTVADEHKTGYLHVILVSDKTPTETVTFDLKITVKTASDETFYTTPVVQP